MRTLHRFLTFVAVTIAVTVIWAGPGALKSRDLSFDERVRAQEAIERVYYSHQIGATVSFEQAVPREVLERKVRTTLKQSIALEKFWNTPVTAEALQRELERIARTTRFPERLEEIYDALHHDPLLIQECFARSTLVDRLTRNRFEADQTLHGEAPELDWSQWWDSVSADLDESAVQSVAAESLPLPVPGGNRPGTHSASRIAAEAAAPLNTCLQDVWDNGSLDHPPLPAEDLSAVWTGTEMIVWGGNDQGESLARLDRGGRYDPLTNSWAPTSRTNAPAPRTGHTAVWTGSRMLIWGGVSTTEVLHSGAAYDPATDTWTSLSTLNDPGPRLHHTAVWTGSRMLVWGGTGVNGLSVGDGRSYDPGTDQWALIPSSPLVEARSQHTAIWSGTEMIVWGGYHDSDNSKLSTGGRYNPSTNSWLATSTASGLQARYLHSAVWTGTRMIVWDGGQGDGARYDPATDSWQSVSLSNAPSPRQKHIAIWTGARMLVWGGSDAGGLKLNSGASYDPGSNSWTAMSLSNAPEARIAHVAVWSGTRMVVWGGQGASVSLETGGQYDPVADSWTPTAIVAFRPPVGPAVWTGSLLVMWSGTPGSSPGPAVGGRYDPLTDAWSGMSTSGAPATRLNHTAVWTGSKVVFWGGQCCSGTYLNDGGRYDPVADSWLPTSIGGQVPVGRAGHSAVWTGSRMLIWGGFNIPFQTAVVLNSGGSYDPAGDTWTALSTTNAPAARSSHSAVWTGTRMIVYGGGPPSSLLNSGGIYNPASDSWTPTSQVGAPSPRLDYSSVWTGSRMVIWGGATGVFPSVRFNTGGRYNPATDSWSMTSVTGAPTARQRHSAVWTGGHMVIWGGFADAPGGGANTQTGGAYNPATNSWFPTSTVNAPSAMSGHAAVWADTAILVWGGRHLGGGRYVIDQGPDLDDDFYPVCAGDCNDADPTVHPGAAEVCNGLDEDCDQQIDEGFTDADMDGYAFCVDCSDNDPSVHPEAVEICNFVDDDCDSMIDEGFDADGDGISQCGGDCNDADPSAWATPFEVPELTIQSTGPLTWSWFDEAPYVGPGVSYQIPSGTLGPGFGIAFDAATCLGSTTTPEFVDSRPDPPGSSAYWYLVRARNSCAVGSYGMSGSGSERLVPACP